METTPVQLHATLFPSGDPAGRGILRTCAPRLPDPGLATSTRRRRSCCTGTGRSSPAGRVEVSGRAVRSRCAWTPGTRANPSRSRWSPTLSRTRPRCAGSNIRWPMRWSPRSTCDAQRRGVGSGHHPEDPVGQAAPFQLGLARHVVAGDSAFPRATGGRYSPTRVRRHHIRSRNSSRHVVNRY